MRIKNIFSRISRFIPIQLCFTTKLLLFLQTFLIVYFLGVELFTPFQKNFKINHDFEGIFAIVLSYFSIILFVQLINLLTQKKPVLRVTFNICTILLYIFLLCFHMATRNSLDYSLVYDNFAELFYSESLDLFLTKGRFLYFVGMFAFVLFLVFLEKKKKILSRWKKPQNYLYNLSFTVVVYIIILLSPVLVYENLTYFFQSIYQYHMTDFSAGIDDDTEFPYINEPAIDTGNPIQTQTLSSNDLPNIFIIMVESFNARFVEVKNEKGVEITPLFNSLIKKGVYIKHFYSNSIQTVKGKLPTLCSIIPSYRGKVYTQHTDLNLHSLADILQEYNYETLYFKAARNLTFDNEGEFAKHMGFNIRKAMTEEFTNTVDEKYNWGWGLQDDQYYIKYFEVLDRLRNENSKNKKFFTIMATISNHARFNRVPEEQWEMYRNPADIEEDYANSIHVSDKYMREFFRQLKKRDYLKNSIVIILGDHGFPIGEHGNYSNEVGAYEESFHVPFVLLWNGHLKPKYIDEFAYSQRANNPRFAENQNS